MSKETSPAKDQEQSQSESIDVGKTLGNVEFQPAKFTIHRQVERSLDTQFSKERQHPFILQNCHHIV